MESGGKISVWQVLDAHFYASSTKLFNFDFENLSPIQPFDNL
jgi:hypothetical protein